MILPKDFIETADGLVFAVVDAKPEDGRVLSFLRYQRQQGRWLKLSTDSANQLLASHFPEHLYFSRRLQASLHAVPDAQIAVHHQPRQRLQRLRAGPLSDPLETTLREFCLLLQQQGVDLSQVGVTGSLLIGAQNQASDIDLVFYCRQTFQRTRDAVRTLQQQGACQALTRPEWRQAWLRRDCDLSLDDYIAAERRKFNKVIFQQRKIDLSLVANDAPEIAGDFVKQGPVCLTVQIASDRYAFDYPAVYSLNHAEISTIVCFTATYHGHAQTGEWVEVSGQLEVSTSGERRIVVGSSREARGEYIRLKA